MKFGVLLHQERGANAVLVGARTRCTRLAFAMLNLSFRHPPVLAKMLSTLDQITHGRVICSIGAGWFEDECSAYDIPFVADHDERIAREREVALLFKQLWTHPAPERTTFHGRYIRVTDLPVNPAPYQQPHPPIWIGGDSEATQKLMKEAGDTHQSAVDAATSVYASGGGGPTQSLEAFLQAAVIGTPDECVATLREVESWGVNYIRLAFHTTELQTEFARTILPDMERRAMG